MTRNQYMVWWGAIMAVLIVCTGIAGVYDALHECQPPIADSREQQK